MLQIMRINQVRDVIENKVIRPKSRALALSKTVGQTDRLTVSFKKTFETSIYYSKVLLHYSEAIKSL